jgi:putative membrane protein
MLSSPIGPLLSLLSASPTPVAAAHTSPDPGEASSPGTGYERPEVTYLEVALRSLSNAGARLTLSALTLSALTLSVLTLAAAAAVAGCTASHAAPKVKTAATVGPASPSPTAATTATTAAPLSSADAAFLATAASDAQFEVESGRLATSRAADSRLREFGSRMIRDHSQEYQSIQALARGAHITVPSGPAPEQRNILSAWSAERGGAFDCSYAPAMFLGHDAVVMAFTTEATSAGSAQVRQFANRELPTLRDHLGMAGQNLNGLRCGASPSPTH